MKARAPGSRKSPKSGGGGKPRAKKESPRIPNTRIRSSSRSSNPPGKKRRKKPIKFIIKKRNGSPTISNSRARTNPESLKYKPKPKKKKKQTKHSIRSGHGDYKPKPLQPKYEVGKTYTIYV